MCVPILITLQKVVGDAVVVVAGWCRIDRSRDKGIHQGVETLKDCKDECLIDAQEFLQTQVWMEMAFRQKCTTSSSDKNNQCDFGGLSQAESP
jgi:hypothetical protein